MTTASPLSRDCHDLPSRFQMTSSAAISSTIMTVR